MPSADHPLRVFLCHARADRDAVRALYSRLTKDGVDAWLDKEKLLPGQDWELEIRKAVREADVVVVCLSKQFNQAGFRQKEVRLALDTAMEKPEGEIFIIPARLEECDTLESLKKWHWVDLFDDDGYEMLIRALRARADKIGATLQIKKGWLPKVPTTPVKSKKYSTPIERSAESEQEKFESKRKSAKRKLNSQNVIIFIALVGLILVSLFGLPSLIGKPESTFTAINAESLRAFTTTPTPIIVSITVTPTPILVGVTPTPILARPVTYTLQWGEWLSCIARRFNVDFDELLVLNGLAADSPIYPGQIIKIPRTGSFSGERTLRFHPAKYTVTSSDETISGIACLYGDVFPDEVAALNGLPLNAELKVGQVLQIP